MKQSCVKEPLIYRKAGFRSTAWCPEQVGVIDAFLFFMYDRLGAPPPLGYKGS